MKTIATILLTLTLLGCADPYSSVGSVCQAVVLGEASTDARSTVSLGGCTGTLIAPGVVLSAAHCGPRFRVTFGINPTQGIGIVETILHPGFDAEAGLANDLAIHFLEYDSAFPIAPIALPTLGAAIVQGYGRTEEGTSGELREATTEVVRFIGDSRILTAAGPDSCYGDSGGPLYQGGALVGVVSSGIAGGDCGDGGIYTAAAPFVGWLTENGVLFETIGGAC